MASPDSLRQENGALKEPLHVDMRACDWNNTPGQSPPPQHQSKQDVDPDTGDYSEGTKSSTLPSDPPERIITEFTREKVCSDTHKDGGGERPVRQKLKETSIAGTGTANPDQASEQTKMGEENGELPEGSMTDTNATTERGRLKKKRSFDDLMNDDGQSGHYEESGHRRKRSRDSKMETTPEREAEPDASTAELEKVKSPKKKRSRDQFDKDLDSKAGDESVKRNDDSTADPSKENAESESLGASPNSRAEKGEPEKKRHRDNSQDRHTEEPKDTTTASKSALPNPFSNTSATSPFGSLGASKQSTTKPVEQSTKEQSTNPSAFAASKLAAFSGSETSPFGAIGGGASIFKSKPSTKGEEDGKTSSTGSGASPFAAAASGPSPFGASFSGSAFAKSSFASGFAAAAPKPGERLTSFASPKPANFGSTTKPKAFGSKEEKNDDDDEEGEDDGEGDEEKGETFQGLEEEKEDTRFFKQETETGEEDEETHFSVRGKLFHFTGSEWKERGIGTFKLNVKKLPESAAGDEEEGGAAATKPTKRSARFIMRTDGVFRLILNIPLYKGMKVGDAEGKEPTGKHVQIAGVEDGRTVPLLLRTSNADAAKDLHAAAQEILHQM
ncbi:nuclear protein export protein Yrb2, putative [Trichophyton benhamiae CBS 112371]|uniref:Nuclear protein export protein Yrb2, putative n=1 Tax=Arthroderma benhamiae (strain ATCC MYA-4681 / CBS 112371) TaxID=663331 RepID=D4ANL7_ARTBC|nr:nuclear protein export protein Yrb2, putative [Trichophyton benhamiae CBS 112371]EFE34878.1 nuclear protein export protein Yrb2, putative [Trichophyton benhamiae CBS 112371]